MLANYHGHTRRCRHAFGTEREYIERAIAGGYKEFGFSDHAPQVWPEGYDSGMRMFLYQLPEYIQCITDLKKEYEKDIKIFLGFETEYYPDYFSKLMEEFSNYPEIDYMILGQHFLYNEINAPASGAPTDSVVLLKQYVKQTSEALKTGLFSYFAHPDIMNFIGDENIYYEEMKKICLVAKEYDVPLEINFLGLMDDRQYPNPKFWEIAGEVKNKVIFGADCHNAESVVNPLAEERALKIVDKFKLDHIEFLKMKEHAF